MTESCAVFGLLLFAYIDFLIALGRGDAPGRMAAALLYIPLVTCYIALSLERLQRALRASVSTTARASGVMALLVAAIAAYCLTVGLPVAPRALTYTLYLFAPLLVLRIAPASSSDTHQVANQRIRHVIAAVLLWLPLSLGWLRLRLPTGFDVSHLIAIVAALYLFLIVEPLEGIGYSFGLRLRDWRLAAAAFLLFTLVAVPVGFATRFLAWHPQPSVNRVLTLPVRIYLATAIPEEFLFRGVFQNLAVRALGFPAGLALAAIVFGLSHPPDPRYMALAAIAGVAYGWVYQRTGRITASALTHAAVDWVWKLLFRL